MPSTSDIFQHYPWQVRPVSIFFDPASVYGTREGYHSGLLVTSSDRTNYFTKSPVYKSGVVHGVGMLPRLLGCVFFSLFLFRSHPSRAFLGKQLTKQSKIILLYQWLFCNFNFTTFYFKEWNAEGREDLEQVCSWLSTDSRAGAEAGMFVQIIGAFCKRF